MTSLTVKLSNYDRVLLSLLPTGDRAHIGISFGDIQRTGREVSGFRFSHQTVRHRLRRLARYGLIEPRPSAVTVSGQVRAWRWKTLPPMPVDYFETISTTCGEQTVGLAY